MGALARVLLGVTATLVVAGSPTAAGNRVAARRDATRLLRLFVVPSGARPLRSAPGGAGGLLSSAQSKPGTRELVDVHRLWRVHASLDAAVAFVEAHPEDGSKLDGLSSAGGPRYPRNHGLQFTFRPLDGRISSRQLEVETVALRDGWTGIRVDAQEIWVVPRPPGEVLPPGVAAVEILAPRLKRRVSDPAKVAKIVRWFDGLGIVQPGVRFACPAIAGPPVRLEFEGAGGASLARADVMYLGGISTQCNPIRWSSGGRTQTPLVGGRFLPRLQSLLGERLD